MTIFDTDIFTDYSKGNEKIRQRVERLDEDEVLAVTVITRMEVLRGRFDSILKAADEAELRIAVERFQASEKMLNDFSLAPLDDAAREKFEILRKHKKTRKMKRPRPVDCVRCLGARCSAGHKEYQRLQGRSRAAHGELGRVTV